MQCFGGARLSCLLAPLLCGNRQGNIYVEGLKYVAARRVGCYMCRDGGFARIWELHNSILLCRCTKG